MRSQSSGHQDKDIIKQLKKSNYYEILDVKSGASQAQIKKSFKQMALKYHPDKNSASYSKQVFHKISQAYDTLSDPSKRSAYDQKQSAFKMPKRGFNFQQPSSFYYRSSAFNFQFQDFRKAYHDYERKKSAEFKWDQKARQQREKNKKQFNERNKKEYTTHKNSFFNNSTSTKSSKQEKQNFAQEKQAQKQQETFKTFFKFQKNMFKKPSQSKSEFGEVRRQQQRKIRLQKQKQKVQKNIRSFGVFVLVLVVWILLSQFGPMMKGIPIYSMYPSQFYKIPQFTKKLNSPFFVTEDYVQRAKADDKFREYLDRKIDTMYIKSLSRVCNTMMQKQQELYNNLDIVKSKKSKKQIHHNLQKLDLSACDKLHDVRQLNPSYFKELFLNPNSRQQM